MKNLNLPTLIEVDDYHEFDYLEQYFKKINPKIRVKEVGTNYSIYVGLVYLQGKLPKRPVITTMLEETYHLFKE